MTPATISVGPSATRHGEAMPTRVEPILLRFRFTDRDRRDRQSETRDLKERSQDVEPEKRICHAAKHRAGV